jgi:hypothetical protein
MFSEEDIRVTEQESLGIVIRTNYLHTVVAQLGDFLYVDGGWIQQYQDGQGDETPLLPGNVM